MPLYYQVKNRIANFIEEGYYQTGDKIPTETELCEEFKVSRTTIRIALQQLELEGLIYRVQGKGTFVAKRKYKETFNKAKSFTQQMKDSGLPSHSIILEFEIIPASELATKLDLEEEDAVIKLVRVRYADGDPVQYVTSFIPWKVAPGLVYEDCQGSLFELLQTKFGIHMHRSIDTLQPMLADEKVCRYLQIPVHSPVMSIESINYDIHDVPIEHSRTFVRGDRARFVLEREYER